MFRKKFPFRPPSHVVTPLLRKTLTVIISIDDSGKRVWPSRSCNPVLPRTLYLRVFPCASNTGGENTCIDTQGGWKASDCGRLGRQAAGHPWSALRVVKSCRKTAQRPRCCRSQSSSSASKVVPELTI
jgi:hypothetical protein